jgi:hypothetical protein
MLDSRLFALFAFVLLVVKVESSAAQSPITISGVIQHVTCYGNNNGAINITVNGGVPPYSYSWSNSATTEDISGLTAGAYSVTVTASNGSTKNASFTVNQPSALSVNISIQNSNCGASNGKVTASASGGTPPYSYQWSTGHTTQTVNALYGGTYYVTVTDAAGCSVIQQVYVPIGNSNQYITGTVSSTPVTCYGGSNGTAIHTHGRMVARPKPLQMFPQDGIQLLLPGPIPVQRCSLFMYRSPRPIKSLPNRKT